MIRRCAYPLGLITLTVLLVVLAFHADAGIILYSNRDAWQTALESDLENAVNFTAFRDASFASSAYNFGSFTLSTLGTALPGTNYIVGPPFDDVNNPSIDGTAFASMFLDGTHSVAFQPLSSIRAFGGDFAGTGMINFSVFTLGRGGSLIGGPGPGVQFFGFISTDPVSRIEFRYAGPVDESTVAGLDNVLLDSSRVVPEPASLLMLGMGATLLGGYGCWKRQRKLHTPQDQV